MTEIILKHVSLSYPVFGGASRSFKKDLLNSLMLRPTESKKILCVDALKDISLTLNKGDYIGLIGHNGAGKSTLLKLLSGIYEPTYGELTVKGSVSSILGNSVGMQPELTGYENIKFTSLINNFSKSHIVKIIQDIEEFTGLGEMLNLPVKKYSSGMQARLSFGLATAVKPDILLLDEIVGAGDAAFIKKARKRIDQLISTANLLVFASHSTDLIEKFCNKILWLDHGKIKMFGDVKPTLNAYLDYMEAAV